MFRTSKYLLLLMFLLNRSADTFSQTNNPLAEYKWKNRLIIINTESEKAQEQIRLFDQATSDFEDRDLVLIQLAGARVYIDSTVASDLDARTIRSVYQIGEKFECILIGKDGAVKQRHDNVTNPEYFFEMIDQMPMRQAEVRE